ncbi:MAG: dihydropteroate synthase [Actinomycetota bacterium]
MTVRARVLSFSQRGDEVRDGFAFIRPRSADEIRAREHRQGESLFVPTHTVVIEGLDDVEAVSRALGHAGIENRRWKDSIILRIGGTAGIRETLARVNGDALDALDRALLAWSRPPRDIELANSRRMPLSKRAHVMGILNVTPDSFSDGGRFFDADAAVKHALRLVEEGADIIDVGGESTRPGAEAIEASEEIRRVIPVVEHLARETTTVISIDTSKAAVARAALDAGAHIVNDVSAGLADPGMVSLVAERAVPVVLMHMRGVPRTMQEAPSYDDAVGEVYGFLDDRARAARQAGIAENKIIVDPGVGFGKTPEHNLVLLRRLRELTCLGYPVLIGTSRKSFIGKTLGGGVDDRLEGTAATVALAVEMGAAVVRVHDAGYMRRVVGMVEAVIRATEGGQR